MFLKYFGGVNVREKGGSSTTFANRNDEISIAKIWSSQGGIIKIESKVSCFFMRKYKKSSFSSNRRTSIFRLQAKIRNLVFFPSSQGLYMHNTRFHEIWFFFESKDFYLSSAITRKVKNQVLSLYKRLFYRLKNLVFLRIEGLFSFVCKQKHWKSSFSSSRRTFIFRSHIKTRNLVFFPSSQGLYMVNTRFHEIWFFFESKDFYLSSACKNTKPGFFSFKSRLIHA